MTGDTILEGVGNLPDPVEDEVLAALELEPADRDVRLQELLVAHAGHAAAIRRWLRASGVPLEGQEVAERHDASVPDHIGPYRITERLGRGHFGTVWLALQEQPIRRQVAVKVLNPGMDTREVLSRFHAEREALNRMDHPGIARLLDAGETENGRPFFVMEYVRGETLARHCRHQNLPLRERVELFLLVLDAVQHAHQRAVIHRDLSSNNVLVAEVDGQCRPKVIDFGIAKSLAAPLIEGGVGTFENTLMGTPEFMSPEQARGRVEDIDTRTDIYALGVQLYELLTNTLPIPAVVLRSEGLAGMAHVIESYEPKLPSQSAPAARSTGLSTDLDWIAMKALHKDREGRYATVGEFASDLRAWLRDRPTKARPPGRGERVRRFVRNNPVAVSAVVVMVLALLAALGVSLYFLQAARTAQEQAEAAREQLKQRADAGYRLLANRERLQQAIASEGSLWPAWPQQVPALRDWLEDAEPLVDELPKMREKLAELGSHARNGQFDDPSEQHLNRALGRLERDVVAFTRPGGLLASVRARLQLASTIEQRSLTAHAARWQEACAALKAADGVQSSTRYRGLQIRPQIDLVPIGMDPVTKLWEFLQPSSQRGDALPDREPSGQLRILPETGIVFVLLPPGEFWMGARRNEPGMEQNDPQARDDELGMRVVMLEPFLLARTELTHEQWAVLSGDVPGTPLPPMLPIDTVDWTRGGEVLRHWGLSLPTEAQWEYACRAGTKTPWSFGDNDAMLGRYAWFGTAPQPVARLLPNQFGLYDVHGNVAEWCRDWFTDYAAVQPRRGDGLREAAPGTMRVVRGGAYDWHRIEARCSARTRYPPDTRVPGVGIRPARELQR